MLITIAVACAAALAIGLLCVLAEMSAPIPETHVVAIPCLIGGAAGLIGCGAVALVQAVF